MGLTYSAYLKLDELLRLQQPLSDGPEHDELLFIVVHQVSELWFKQLLHELDLLQLALDNSHTPTIMRTLKRILAIVANLVAQMDILETMTPMSFSSFRERLETASGLESVQFREFEIVLGLRDQRILAPFPEGGQRRERLTARLSRPTLYDSFLRFLAHCGYELPADALERDRSGPSEESPRVQEVLDRIYHSDPAAWQVCELLVDLDQGLQEWRYRHLQMVHRTIGDKPGPDGTSGRRYLESTLGTMLFPDLWAIRRRL